MKIAYITMQFPVPSETFARNDVRRLRRRGLDIEVHALLPHAKEKERLLAESELSELPIYPNGIGPSVAGLVASFRRPQLLWKTLRWIRRSNAGRLTHALASLVLVPRAFGILAELEASRPDVVHIFWGHYPSLVGYLVQESLPELPVSMALNAYDLTMEYGGSREVAQRASFLRTHSKVNVPDVARLTGLPENEVNVIYNGVDIGWLDGIANGTHKVPRRLAVAGRLIDSKGVDEAIEVYAKVRAKWPDASLVVMGDGPRRQALERLAGSLGVGDGVEFLGHVPHARVVEELAKAEVVMLLSRKDSERLPNVIKEGMACRSVCIASDTPGMDELIEHGESGYIVPTGDPQGTAAIVDDVFAGRVDVGVMTAKARRHIEAEFDLEVTTEAYVRTWRSLIERRGGTAGVAVAEVVPARG